MKTYRASKTHLLFPEKPLRKCIDCGKEAWTKADFSLFMKAKTSKFGIRNLCKNCHAKRALQIKRGTYISRKKPLDPNAPLRKCRICGVEAKKPEDLELFVKDYSKQAKHYRGRPHGRKHLCKKCDIKDKKKRQDFVRITVIGLYGGHCACCGESTLVFLDMDHIHNDGQLHRAKERGTIPTWYDMIRQFRETPELAKTKFQVLCSNCNQGKRRNGGICPHKQLLTSK